MESFSFTHGTLLWDPYVNINHSNGQEVQEIMASVWDLSLNLTGIVCKGPYSLHVKTWVAVNCLDRHRTVFLNSFDKSCQIRRNNTVTLNASK